MAQKIDIRRHPIQARSRARVKAILVAAKEIIFEVGSDGMKMSDVALRAHVPIGSVYQFFPNKVSIIHSLAQESLEKVRAGLVERFSNIASFGDGIEKIELAVKDYYQIFKDDPMVCDIWCSTQSDKLLQELDIEDSRLNGVILFDNIKKHLPVLEHKRLSVTCFLCMQLTGAAVRLAITQDKAKADLLMEQYILMLRAGFEEFQF